MSLSFGTFIIEGDYTDRHQELLDALGIEDKTGKGLITFEAASLRDFDDTAITTINGVTIIFNNLLPYDCNFESPENPSYLDKKVASWSATGKSMCLFLQGITGTYGFNYFEQGELKRQWSRDPQTLFSDHGEPMPEEAGYTNGEERIFSVIKKRFGLNLSTLVFDTDTPLSLYNGF